MHRSGGRELSGLYNLMIIGDLFCEQASPWENLAHGYVQSGWKACKTFLRHVVAHVADSGTSTALIQKVFEPAMDHVSATLQAKTREVLKSHQMIHLITYNHYLTETA